VYTQYANTGITPKSYAVDCQPPTGYGDKAFLAKWTAIQLRAETAFTNLIVQYLSQSLTEADNVVRTARQKIVPHLSTDDHYEEVSNALRATKQKVARQECTLRDERFEKDKKANNIRTAKRRGEKRARSADDNANADFQNQGTKNSGPSSNANKRQKRQNLPQKQQTRRAPPPAKREDRRQTNQSNRQPRHQGQRRDNRQTQHAPAQERRPRNNDRSRDEPRRERRPERADDASSQITALLKALTGLNSRRR
jgi:hypothetical protein